MKTCCDNRRRSARRLVHNSQRVNFTFLSALDDKKGRAIKDGGLRAYNRPGSDIFLGFPRDFFHLRSLTAKRREKNVMKFLFSEFDSTLRVQARFFRFFFNLISVADLRRYSNKSQFNRKWWMNKREENEKETEEEEKVTSAMSKENF